MLEALLHTAEDNFVRRYFTSKLYYFNNSYFAQTNGDDNQSLCATMIRDVDRNKLSSKERSWAAGTM